MDLDTILNKLTEQDAAREAVASADAHTNNVGLPTYSELLGALVDIAEAIRQGPPAVIGYDHNGESFNHGWDLNALRLWHILNA